MDTGKDEEIIDEVIALKIPNNPANMRKVAYMLVDKSIFTPSAVLSICLARFPLQSIPPIDRKEFMAHVKISYLKQIRSFAKRSIKSFNAEEANHFAHFLAALLKSSAIDNVNFVFIIENLIDDASDFNNVALDMILRIFKAVGDDLSHIRGQIYDNVGLSLRKISTGAPKKAKKVIKEILSLLERMHTRVEASERSQPTYEGLLSPLVVAKKVRFTELLTNLHANLKMATRNCILVSTIVSLLTDRLTT